MRSDLGRETSCSSPPSETGEVQRIASAVRAAITGSEGNRSLEPHQIFRLGGLRLAPRFRSVFAWADSYVGEAFGASTRGGDQRFRDRARTAFYEQDLAPVAVAVEEDLTFRQTSPNEGDRGSP